MTWPSSDPSRDDPYRADRNRDPNDTDAGSAQAPESMWARPEPGQPPADEPSWAQPPQAPYQDPAEPYGQAPPPYGQTPPSYGPATPPYGPATPPYGAAPPTYPGQGQQAQPYQPYGQPPSQPAGPRTNGLAVAALVCSLAGIATGITAPLGAVLGHVALRQIRQTGEEGSQLAKAAIWVGWTLTGIVVIGCCAVIAAVIAASRSGQLQ